MTVHKIGAAHQMHGAANQANQQYNPWNPPPSGSAVHRVPSIQLGVDPVSKQAEATRDLAAAIRELADVLFHIHTED